MGCQGRMGAAELQARVGCRHGGGGPKLPSPRILRTGAGCAGGRRPGVLGAFEAKATAGLAQILSCRCFDGDGFDWQI